MGGVLAQHPTAIRTVVLKSTRGLLFEKDVNEQTQLKGADGMSNLILIIDLGM